MNSEPIGPDSTPTVQDDIRLIVSGNFNEDSLGTERHRAILVRLAAAPLEYLQAFRAFVRERMDAGRLSTLHLPWFLTLLARTDPAAAREAARELLGEYEKAVEEVGRPEQAAPRAALQKGQRAQQVPPETEHDKLIDRLHSRSAELQRILQA
jgi:hypothetical protein